MSSPMACSSASAPLKKWNLILMVELWMSPLLTLTNSKLGVPSADGAKVLAISN